MISHVLRGQHMEQIWQQVLKNMVTIELALVAMVCEISRIIALHLVINNLSLTHVGAQ